MHLEMVSMSLPKRILALPALLAYRLTASRAIIDADIRRWAELEQREGSLTTVLLGLIVDRKEFRSLMYHRLCRGGTPGRLLGRICFLLLRPQALLYLECDDIGPGFYIQHGFGTGIFAERVGANCWVNQHVTVGAAAISDTEIGIPIIDDGATLYVGATVVGSVRVGRNAVVGANAVVVKDVPDRMLAVGVPAQIREPRARG